MNRHPGGEAQTLHLLEYVKFRKGMEALDLGAGEGETVRILKSLGINAHGVDLSPRSRDVQKGDFLNLDYTASVSVHFLSAEISKKLFQNVGVY